MILEHILKFFGILLLMSLLTFLGSIGYLANTVIIFVGLWKLTE